jgi:hypothetical protein
VIDDLQFRRGKGNPTGSVSKKLWISGGAFLSANDLKVIIFYKESEKGVVCR